MIDFEVNSIAVIAILAALLLPALNRAREASYRSDCINNHKAVMLQGLIAYSSDYDDWTLGYMAFACGGPWATTWAVRLGKGDTYSLGYLDWNAYDPKRPSKRGWGVFRCLAEKQPLSGGEMVNLGIHTRLASKFSYRKVDTAQTYFKLSSEKRPSIVGALGDCLPSVYYVDCNAGPPTLYYLAFRHSDAANLAFLDGHVEAVRQTQLMYVGAGNDIQRFPWGYKN